MATIGSFGSRKINSLFSLICRLPDIDKIYLYAKDPCEAENQLLINKPDDVGLKELNGFKAFYWMLDWYE